MNSREHVQTAQNVSVIVDGNNINPTGFYTAQGGAILGYGLIIALGGDYLRNFDDLDSQNTLDSTSIISSPMFTGLGEFDITRPVITTRYLTLALHNAEHFRNPFVIENGNYTRSSLPALQQDSLSIYTKGHRAAINNAHLLTDEKRKRRRYAINAFYCHFLTDMYSSSHMRVPRRCLHGIFSDRIGSIIINIFNSPINPIIFNIDNAVAKLMHDEDGNNGLFVTNEKSRNTFPQTWKAFGDDHQLDQVNNNLIQERNWNTCLLAVQLSAKRIEEGLKNAITITEKEITDLMPNPFPPGAKVFESSSIDQYTVNVIDQGTQDINDAVIVIDDKGLGFIILDWQIKKILNSFSPATFQIRNFSRVSLKSKKVYKIETNIKPGIISNGLLGEQSFPMYFIARNRLLVRIDESISSGRYISVEHKNAFNLNPPYEYDEDDLSLLPLMAIRLNGEKQGERLPTDM